MSNPFRQCDIRGIYPEEINEELFRCVGARVASRCQAGEAVLVGRDCRASSEALRQALTDGLLSGGIKVLDAGVLPTPVLYFGKRTLGVGYALSVTASHNPPSYNGLKILPPDHGRIADEVRSLAIPTESPVRGQTRGTLAAIDLIAPYRNWLLDRWQDQVLHAVKAPVVLDPGNGAWSGTGGRIFESMGFHATSLHDEPAGTFPNRSPDCTAPQQLRRLREAVRQQGAAAGFAWDGDGDRLVLCDDAGRVLSTDQVALLTLPRLLSQDRGALVLIDVKMSRRVRTVIESHGGKALIERSAHCLLEQAMGRNQCSYGYEYSGHYFFRELGSADDAMFAALQFCALLLQGPRKLSALVDELPALFITPDIRIPGGQAEFDEIEARLSAEFPNQRLSRLDGLKIELADGWLLVRQSVSENRISWRIEGDTATSLSAMLRRASRALPDCRDIFLRYEPC